ncbi:MAG: CAP domain-containing protein [Patescibacteria group bacterium]|nr:CAP domain-containing protein [Patescibacteria group bacterium]
MKGIKKQYLYTDRVTKDKTGWYTRMREEPNEKSKRGELLRPGDKIRVIDSKEKDAKNWYFVEIFNSHDKELEGKRGWIEKWLVDDTNVPVEPSPTPSPTRTPPMADTPSGEGATESKSSGSESDSATISADAEALFGMINDYREKNGLDRFERSERLCSIARERAPEIRAEAMGGTIHAGFVARGYGYPTAVENAAAYGNIHANFNWWINSGLHRGSILGPELKYSCVECSAGNCVQIFSPNP